MMAEALAWVQLGASALLILAGLFILGVATFGIHRLDYVLNRIHIAAKCDTLGILLVLAGLIVSGRPLFCGLKMFLVIVFMWLANPVANHLIVRLEVETNDQLEEKCEVIHHEDI